ncbi:N-6 DNA methylase [Spirosoma soli]|uniref:site-specific DNA-methyltransferase (adenine-specific) n=1 Tax=Spirosoma soli TaxID=1770529 RepID=A0ABW5MAP2_9BACT
MFKNAFLPYRDPETLKLFLKTINGFAYDHSEDLGDAFEYLLQVMGSQGDAGQFRTPRHIIDFMVNVVQPQKHETIADTACGTAGFLVSSYNYIRNQNTSKNKGDLLTPDDRKRLVENIKGYDISPDMVRLSLVNLYLHGFTNPQVVEYDTLTSEDNWNERFDVILANPPFMSPKGGIKPHRRFSIQSNRSEVLFLDYIAEHLRPGGRAAVIVPEGIIFQSGTAYKALRKLLVDKYLWAVVSLPAGVFNPYSGVKTSILLLDRTLAPKTDSVLFVKVKADGYDLGAQRRPIDKNDLPNALKLLTAYRQTIQNGTVANVSSEFVVHDDMGLVVEKERIVGSGEYNLSGERYKAAIASQSSDYPKVRLGDVCEINPGKAELRNFKPGTEVTFLPMSDLQENRMTFQPKEIRQLHEVMKGYTFFRDNDVLLAKITPCFENGKAGIARGLKNGIGFGSTEYYVIRPGDQILPEWVYYFISSHEFKRIGKFNMTGSAGQQRVAKDYVANLEIPVPPLAVQQQIVAEIEGYQRIIDGARQVVEAYKPQIQIDPSWEMVALGNCVESTQLGLTKGKGEQGIEVTENTFPYIKMENITYDGQLLLDKVVFVESTADELSRNTLKDGDFIYNTRNAPNLVGKSTVFHGEPNKFLFNNNILRIRFTNDLIADYANYYMNSPAGKAKISSLVAGTTSVAALYQKEYLSIQIPLPSLKTQQQIVAEIEREQALVNANKELISLFEQKIKDRVAAVWGKKPEANETPVVPMSYALVDEEVAMVAEE